MEQHAYKSRDFNLSGLQGISDRTLEMHFGLYDGYVKNTNLLTEQLLEMSHKKQALATNPAYSELKRHLGFEYGGMVLHEYYFGNLAPKGKESPSADLRRALEANFGTFEDWKRDFVAVGGMRGVGWAVLYQDPMTGQLSNHWIELHQQGVPSGFKPVLVMDVWEHAFLLDYKPSERSKYIDAFFSNIDWDVVNRCLTSTAAVRPAA
ncbi:MAG: superoxide dismutase [Deltaproteobacteria bacterium]|nr:superoxide dismutase [Deltaproteobacteria bacterium]